MNTRYGYALVNARGHVLRGFEHLAGRPLPLRMIECVYTFKVAATAALAEEQPGTRIARVLIKEVAGKKRGKR